MKTVVVTGGAGFIGSNFIRQILCESSGIRVINYDKLTYAGNLENVAGITEGERYRFVRGDIADARMVWRIFEEERPWAVVNFAAESHVDRSMCDPTPFVDTNVKGTHVLLEASRKHGVERFVQISTDEVYGSLGESGVFDEGSPLKPNNPYAACKAAADLIALAYARSYGLPVIITRSSNNYGPYQFPEKLIPLMIRNAVRGCPLPVYGEGKQVRDWIYVEDNCRGIAAVLAGGRVGEVYNIGGGEERTNLEVVQLICEYLSRRIGHCGDLKRLITFIKDPRGAAHDFRYALDCRKIRDELGWTPRISFPEGLARTIDWYLEHQGWVERVCTGEYLEYYAKLYGTGG